MKRKMMILALVLVLAAAAVVCVSCAKKEEAYEEGKVTYTIVNSTGKNVTGISLADNRSANKMEAKPEEGGLPDGQSVGMEMIAMLEKGAPDVMFTFTVEGGDNLSAQIGQKSGTITMLTEDGRPTFSISEPGK